MRIISKTHDYYDSALIHGRDETLVFVRAEEEGLPSVVDDLRKYCAEVGAMTRWDYRVGDRLPYGAFSKYMPESCRGQFTSAEIAIIFVGFCGKVYPAVMYQSTDCSPEKKKTIEVSYIFEDSIIDEQAAQFTKVINNVTPAFISGYLEHHKSSNKKIKDQSYVCQLMHKAAILATAASQNLEPVFVKHKVPYFVVDMHKNTFTLLPLLKHFQFYKVKDSFTTMQEISMYVGGVIPRQEREVVVISDKDRIVQHGFDKLSFRHPFKY